MTLEQSYTPGRGTLENVLPKGQTLCHNVARGRHIFHWHEARGVILTLLYRQADIDTGILTVVKSNMQTCDIGSNVQA